MSTVIAIDPGPTHSAYAYIAGDLWPVRAEKLANTDLLRGLRVNALGTASCTFAIEMVASYGMAVGAEVFDTCVWIGRFHEAVTKRTDREPHLVKRHPIKLHHCHDSRAKDSNIRQALVDRFAPGQPNHGKGTKDNPGWFHGFHSDLWQAYALAVYIADTKGDT